MQPYIDKFCVQGNKIQGSIGSKILGGICLNLLLKQNNWFSLSHGASKVLSCMCVHIPITEDKLMLRYKSWL